MPEKTDHQQSTDRRNYVRLNTLFPVVLVFDNPDTSGGDVKRVQAFTRNVSKGGLCLEVALVDESITSLFVTGHKGSMTMEVPFQKESVQSQIKVCWQTQIAAKPVPRILLGIEYIDLGANMGQTILAYARKKRREPWIWGWVFAILLMTVFLTYKNYEGAIKHLEDSEGELIRVTRELQDIRRERNDLRRLWTALNRGSVLSTQSVEKYTQQIVQMQSRVQTLQDNEYDYRAEAIRLKLEIEALEQKLSDANTESVASLEEELNRTREKSQAAQEEIESLLNNQKELLQERQNIQQEKDRLLKDRSQKQKELRELSQVIDQLTSLEKWRAVQVILDNGSRITGQVQNETELDIELSFGTGTMILKKDRIQKMIPLDLQSKRELIQRWEDEEKNARQLAISPQSPIVAVPPKGLPEIKSPLTPPILVDSKQIYLGKEPYFVRGMAYGIEYPHVPSGMQSLSAIPREIFEKDFRMMQQAGINTIRTYEPLNKELLDIAWKHNLRVIMNICYPSDVTDFESQVHWNHHRDQALKAVRLYKDHPAILMWSLWNDAPWVWGEGGNPVSVSGFEKVNKFLKKLFQEVKAIDPWHPITASNVLGFDGDHLGFDFLDVLGFNAYLGGMDWYLREDAQSTLDSLQQLSHDLKKPVLILETGFSTFVEGLDQDAVIEEQIQLVGDKLAGITIFQWADGWDKAGFKDRQDMHIEEHWGVVTGFREPKPGLSAVSRSFNAMAGSGSNQLPR